MLKNYSLGELKVVGINVDGQLKNILAQEINWNDRIIYVYSETYTGGTLAEFNAYDLESDLIIATVKATLKIELTEAINRPLIPNNKIILELLDNLNTNDDNISFAIRQAESQKTLN